MKGTRMLGNYVEHLMLDQGMTFNDLSKILGCSASQAYAFAKGRAFASFDQLSALAKAFNTSVSALLSGDADIYNSSVVHCMNDFQDTDNREVILDLIDDYVDVLDAVSSRH